MLAVYADCVFGFDAGSLRRLCHFFWIRKLFRDDFQLSNVGGLELRFWVRVRRWVMVRVRVIAWVRVIVWAWVSMVLGSGYGYD